MSAALSPGTAAIVLFGTFFVLFALRVPVAFALVFVWWGVQFVRFGWDQTSELAELPMGFIFVAWPLAGITWVLFLGEAFVASWRVLAGKARA